ncbi:uracil phosphoribosyltransferase [Heliorestis convoluta]|uniref:Uracil phosphoribosyltransferase n=1 Tax=Heliorestis convoluta TaxID=356322 RepID=A0A5Q2MX82_9FIRM|nr:uracil phosphoribosyltransferase [Heliorestis convoluta]QGG47097.1 uracil phosphoribosyltransferase [Heliorestis convoluta]
MAKLQILDHPLIQHKLSLIRQKDKGAKEFRELVEEIAMLMAYEVTRHLPLKEVEIETPVTTATTKMLEGKKLAVVAILRAGLGMVNGFVKLIPAARVGHIGLYRDPDTLEPVEYFSKLPQDVPEREIILIDPMLATGGSASAAISLLKNKGARLIKLVVLVAAPEGVERIQKDHPDIEIYTAALDQGLNDHAYIVPGLGDAGDRFFGTK